MSFEISKTKGLNYIRFLEFQSRNLKGGTGLLLTPVLTLWGSSHIDCHVWRRVIVPSDLAQSFGAICAHYRYRVIHHAITYMRA